MVHFNFPLKTRDYKSEDMKGEEILQDDLKAETATDFNQDFLCLMALKVSV